MIVKELTKKWHDILSFLGIEPALADGGIIIVAPPEKAVRKPNRRARRRGLKMKAKPVAKAKATKPKRKR